MRRAPFLLALLTVVLAVPASADAATPNRGCAKAVHGKRICLPATPRGVSDVLDRFLALGPTPPRGAHRSRAAERLARRLFAEIQARAAAGKPLFRVAATARVRTWSAAGPEVTIGDVPRAFGEQLTGSYTASGEIEARFRNGQLTTELTWQQGQNGAPQGATIEVRDRRGAGATFGMSTDSKVPRCPTVVGDIPARYMQTMRIGRAAALHGKRYWTLADVKVEGSWTGHVGIGAKAERYDLSLRGEAAVRSGVEIAATGKTLSRDATRTYRAALDRDRIPVRTNAASLADGLRLRGPKGTRLQETDVQPLTGLVGMVGYALADIDDALEDGDKRWYDERACATMDYTRAPERVKRGGTAEWEITAFAADGQRVADAAWKPSSTCGELTASATRGPTIRLTLRDTAGAWRQQPYAPACAKAEITTPAGRPRTFDHTIEPEDERGIRVTFDVTYLEDMGAGIVPTKMTGLGRIDLPFGATNVEGTGVYSGTEWAGGITNTCGQDMQKVRAFEGGATVGATRNDDGTLTVAFTADERPFTMAWIVVVPIEGGTRVITSSRPFCGEPNKARTTANIKVTVEQQP